MFFNGVTMFVNVEVVDAWKRLHAFLQFTSVFLTVKGICSLKGGAYSLQLIP